MNIDLVFLSTLTWSQPNSTLWEAGRLIGRKEPVGKKNLGSGNWRVSQCLESSCAYYSSLTRADLLRFLQLSETGFFKKNKEIDFIYAGYIFGWEHLNKGSKLSFFLLVVVSIEVACKSRALGEVINYTRTNQHVWKTVRHQQLKMHQK